MMEVPVQSLMRYGQHLLSVSFWLGFCSLVLSQVDKRLSKDRKLAFDDWLEGKTSSVDAASPDSLYAWFRKRSFGLMIWPIAIFTLILIHYGPSAMWPRSWLLKSGGNEALMLATFFIVVGAFALHLTIIFVIKSVPDIGDGLAGAVSVLIRGVGILAILIPLHFLFGHFDRSIETPIAHVGSAITGIPMVALAGAMIWLATIFLLFCMMLLLHYPMRLCANVLMRWATSPKGAWGALFYFLTGCMGVVRLLM